MPEKRFVKSTGLVLSKNRLEALVVAIFSAAKLLCLFLNPFRVFNASIQEPLN
jgi:hypothetical protein